MAGSIEINPADQARILAKLVALGTFGERVAIQEINRTAQQIRTIATRRVKGELKGLAVSTIRNRFEVEKASKAKPEAAVNVSHRAINLARFGAKEVAKKGGGVSFRVKGSRQFIQKAFIITARYGKGDAEGTTDLVVWRTKSGGGRVGRLPVKGLFSSSVRDVFQNHRDAVLDEESGRLLDNLVKRAHSELAARSGAAA
jgi:hypothetical protein